MALLRITKEFTFEGAHALIGYDGKCKNIHGHSYRLLVTVRGSRVDKRDDPKDGMVLDFSLLKAIVNREIIEPYDHALLLIEGAPLAKELADNYSLVEILKFQPTCENLIIHFAKLIKESLPSGIELFSLKLYETTTSFVEWYADDNR